MSRFMESIKKYFKKNPRLQKSIKIFNKEIRFSKSIKNKILRNLRFRKSMKKYC